MIYKLEYIVVLYRYIISYWINLHLWHILKLLCTINFAIWKYILCHFAFQDKYLAMLSSIIYAFIAFKFLRSAEMQFNTQSISINEKLVRIWLLFQSTTYSISRSTIEAVKSIICSQSRKARKMLRVEPLYVVCERHNKYSARRQQLCFSK